MHFKNESDKNKKYYKDGFICEKENNIITEIINAIDIATINKIEK